MKKVVEAPVFSILNGNWELTLKCTLNCIHCGSRAGKARQNELSLDECYRVADQLVSLGCKNLTMIGGEVFLFKGWEKLAAYLTDKGLVVNIVTNGYILGELEIEKIRQAGLFNVGISMDGMEANHNQIRGRGDAFQRLKNSLDLLRQHGIATGVITTLMRSNFNDLEAMYAFLIKRGVQVWQLQLASPMGNLAGQENVTLSPAQVKQVIEFIRGKSREREMIVLAADSIGYFDDNETYIRGNSSPICYWGGCSAGISSVFIDSIGNVKGCGALYDDIFIEGNLRERSLGEIWNDPGAFAYNRKFSPDQLTGRCKGCEAGDLCRGGCRSSNYFSTGSLFSNAYCSRNN